MAFLNKSIEESLKLLNEEATIPKKRGRPKRNMSPMRAPHMSPTPKIENKKSPTRIEIRKSPVSIVNTIENEEYVSDNEESKEDDDIIQTLEKNYFSIIRLIVCDGIPSYIVTYDPNGQVVYVKLTDVYTINNKGFPVIKIEKEDYVDFSFSVKEYLKNRITNNIYGVVMNDNSNYGFMKKDDSGDIIEEYYGTNKVNGNISMYCIYRYEDIKRDFETAINSISRTYFMIQQYQLILNKDIYTNLREELEKLNNYFEQFDSIYTQHTESILTDWQHFSNIANDYNNKFIEDKELPENMEENYKKVSANMFARFKAFNLMCSSLYEFQSTNSSLEPIKLKLKDITNRFFEENEKISSKILDKDEIELSL